MFNPICLFLDFFLSVFLAWNEFLDSQNLGFLRIDEGAIDTMFDWFLFSCGLTEAE